MWTPLQSRSGDETQLPLAPGTLQTALPSRHTLFWTLFNSPLIKAVQSPPPQPLDATGSEKRRFVTTTLNVKLGRVLPNSQCLHLSSSAQCSSRCVLCHYFVEAVSLLCVNTDNPFWSTHTRPFVSKTLAVTRHLSCCRYHSSPDPVNGVHSVTGDSTTHREKRTNIHASSGIQTHNPRVRAVKTNPRSADDTAAQLISRRMELKTLQ
jgi:hypothetical protein